MSSHSVAPPRPLAAFATAAPGQLFKPVKLKTTLFETSLITSGNFALNGPSMPVRKNLHRIRCQSRKAYPRQATIHR